ncbi:hypothetical protein MUCCIDRAFT_110801 [Mucor lusitanicus CBS 277.49]|uniref:Uncharacterized protein n=1 Tax=Mucor lusitanicus CBS 277.49 TaxID=747725 RepID=A0A168LT14_MUCCL|nr:hypothetical protein MUCCIDRAFT_110801 [Mucor lusitanicus CBS 277.49]
MANQECMLIQDGMNQMQPADHASAQSAHLASQPVQPIYDDNNNSQPPNELSFSSVDKHPSPATVYKYFP